MNISDYNDYRAHKQALLEAKLEIPTYVREAAEKELKEAQKFHDEGDIAVDESEDRSERLEASWGGFLDQIAESGRY